MNSSNSSENNRGAKVPTTVSRHQRGDVWSWVLGMMLGLTVGALLLVIVPLWMSGALTTQNKPKVQTETQAETQAETTKTQAETQTATQQTQQPTDTTNVDKANTVDKANKQPDTKPDTQKTQEPTQAETKPKTDTPAPTTKTITATKTATIPPAVSGQEVYLTRCSGCHTMNGRGGIGSKLDKAAALPWDAFATAVRNAPTVGGSAEGSNAAGTNVHSLNLSETQLKAVYAYLNEIY